MHIAGSNDLSGIAVLSIEHIGPLIKSYLAPLHSLNIRLLLQNTFEICSWSEGEAPPYLLTRFILTIKSSWLNVVKGLKRTNQIVKFA
jgi:hypothetical protein